MHLTIGSRSLDLTGVLPLTIGDWKRIEREYKISPGHLDTAGGRQAEALAALALYACRKVDPTVAETDIEALTLTDLLDLAAATRTKSTPDRPTSTPSTSSAASTAGVRRISRS